MEKRDYNFALCERFKKDFDLPIEMISHPVYFFYELELLQPTYDSVTKWNEMVVLINKFYNGNPEEYLDDYYRIRNEAIEYILDSPEYKKFNDDVDSYRAWKSVTYPKARCNGAYNQFLVNHDYISVDMKSANFQVMKYLGIIKDETFADFLKRFGNPEMAEFISNKKRLRQVIFGKCNPNRQITLEKTLMLSTYKDIVFQNYQSELIHFGADEFVIRVNEGDDKESVADMLNEKLCENSDLKLTVTPYYLEGYDYKSVHNDGTIHKIGEFYHKSSDKPYKFKGLPQQYYRIIYKLLNANCPIGIEDRMIDYNKCTAALMNDFVVEKMNS